MREIFSLHRKFHTWRRIWLALAESQRDLGLPISESQLAALREHLDTIDFARAADHERKLRHDVMAHVHTFGDAAPEARGILHMGATSQDVVCNADILIQREALELIAVKIARVVDRLGTFAHTWRDLPTLGWTHFQPAQPTTVGKRATLWAQDFAESLFEIETRAEHLRLRGMRGATGTQASFLALFEGDAAKVDELETLMATRLGWNPQQTWTVSGQTYPRLADAQLLSSLAVAAAAIHKCCNDLRLLANLREVEEPFEKDQIGSSAMAYKRNPMRCERATGLARFVMSLSKNGLDTAATQWMERTLDDSANRRLSIPESFLALDGALDILDNVTSGLVVHPAVVAGRLASELPFIATEDLLMDAVRRGGDRQEIHEVIRQASLEASRRMKEDGLPNNLLEQLQQEPAFKGTPFDAILDPSRYVGRAPEQVDIFLEDVVTPIRSRYRDTLTAQVDLHV
ncbi:MAG: adenylosuccinate lyase [Phycisphaerales bacterium]|nr:adenylosuccinate lyase [Phycisphaerales bacterium]